MGIRDYINNTSSFITEKKCASKKEELEVKYVDEKEPEEIKEEFNIDEVIKDLGEIDWTKDDESKAKALQLLKGLVYAKDKKGDAFLKAISDASTGIANKMLKTQEEEVKKDKEKTVSESLLGKATHILDGISEERVFKKQKESTICSTANSLL